MNALDQALQQLYSCLEQNLDTAQATARALDVIVQTNDAQLLRNRIPQLTDWAIPTAIQFAMHVQLLRVNSGESKDVQRFADFLHVFYEDMDDWAAALRRSTLTK